MRSVVAEVAAAVVVVVMVVGVVSPSSDKVQGRDDDEIEAEVDVGNDEVLGRGGEELRTSSTTRSRRSGDIDLIGERGGVFSPRECEI